MKLPVYLAMGFPNLGYAASVDTTDMGIDKVGTVKSWVPEGSTRIAQAAAPLARVSALLRFVVISRGPRTIPVTSTASSVVRPVVTIQVSASRSLYTVLHL